MGSVFEVSYSRLLFQLISVHPTWYWAFLNILQGLQVCNMIAHIFLAGKFKLRMAL